MSAYDLLIRGGEAVLPGIGHAPCDIAIREGRIAAILEPAAPAEATASFDASGLVVMPGAIDAHIHLGHGKDISRPRVPDDATQESAADHQQGHSSSQGACSMVPRAPRIMSPQEGSGGCTPRPRKDRPLSSTMAEATVS